MRLLTLNKFYVFVFLIVLTSCSTEEVLEGSLVEREGLLYKVNTDTPFTGLSIRYHSINYTQYLSKQYIKDGKKHGLFEAFHYTGQLGVRGNYKDGKEHGLAEEFHENG